MDKEIKYSKDWVRLDMMINEKTGEYHVLKGDLIPGCGGNKRYIGLNVLKLHRMDRAKGQIICNHRDGYDVFGEWYCPKCGEQFST